MGRRGILWAECEKGEGAFELASEDGRMSWGFEGRVKLTSELVSGL